jgi:hypothetical protein
MLLCGATHFSTLDRNTAERQHLLYNAKRNAPMGVPYTAVTDDRWPISYQHDHHKCRRDRSAEHQRASDEAATRTWGDPAPFAHG